MKMLEYNMGDSIRAFSTMRGEGPGCYGGFNITHYCGDSRQHVAACRSELCSYLGIDDSRLILPRQTHGCGTIFIDAEFMQLPKNRQEELLQGIDAIATRLTDTCIGVSTADCIPLLLHDCSRDTIAAIHAGWRGTVAGIAARTITAMRERYGTEAGSIKAVIAPGISLEAFEIGDEVYEEFAGAGFPMELIAGRYPAATGGEKWHIDLWEANRLQLVAAGVLPENIQVAGICTYKEHERFFSARRLGINSGRIFSGILIESRD